MRMRDWSIARQFVVTGGTLMFIAMIISGQALSSVASRAAIDGTASSTALLVDSILAPVTADLVTDLRLDRRAISALEQVFSDDEFAQRFPHLDIWLPDGTVLYSRDASMVGQRFSPPPGVVAAARGTVHAEFADLTAGEHVFRSFNEQFLEIYLPLRNLRGDVLAIAEIHEFPEMLHAEVGRVQTYTWLMVAAFSFMLMLGLTGVVYRASRLIEDQKDHLHRRIVEIEQISRQNATLRDKARAAGSRMSETVEATLRRVGAELHDGPAQQLGYAALVADSARTARGKIDRDRYLKLSIDAVRDALADIRGISKGLMLPELEGLTFSQVIERAIRNHEKRTETRVRTYDDCPAIEMPHAVKLCAYRFVQEGLSNAYQHAGGAGQRVACTLHDSELTIIVRDSGGAGMTRSSQVENNRGLGLIGLRERVETLGGSFGLRREGTGTTLMMSIVLGRAHGHA